MSALALPLTAINVLGADAFQVGVLMGIGGLPALVLSLPAGVLVDRLSPRRVVVTTSAFLAAVLISTQVAERLGVLSFGLLCLLAVALGAATVLFSVAQQALVSRVIASDDLVDANSKLEAARASAGLAGPAIAGTLADRLSPPSVFSAAALLHLLSALFFSSVRHTENPPTARRMSIEIREGLLFVLRQPSLRVLMGAAATWNFFSAMAAAVFVLYATRSAGVSGTELGLVFTGAQIGIIAASIVAARLTSAIGVGRLFAAAMFIGGASVALLGVTVSVIGLLLLQFMRSACIVVYNVNQLSFRQSITPFELQGRVHATAMLIALGTWPAGAFVGGGMAAAAGPAITLVVAGVCMSAGAAWIVLSPLFRLQEINEQAPHPIQSTERSA